METMKFGASILMKLLLFQCLSVLCAAQSEIKFYYFVQQWPGSFLNTTTESFCYPTTGKPPSEFGISGLWPADMIGLRHRSCSHDINSYNESLISDLISRLQRDWPSLECPSNNGSALWANNWNIFGTCSGRDQHAYFNAALNLKSKIDLLQVLQIEGINPDNNRTYSPQIDIESAIMNLIGYRPMLHCSSDADGRFPQVNQIIVCVDAVAFSPIECPDFLHVEPPYRNCYDFRNVKFPSF